MSASEQWYVGQRAESLAVVLFTRDSTIAMERTPQGMPGVDFLVRVDMKSPGRIFGLEVKGTERMDRLVDAGGKLKSGLEAQLVRMAADYTHPVGVLLVDVARSEARFGWILAPVVSLKKRTFLKTSPGIKTTPADRKGLSEVIRRVQRWYEARASRAS